MKKLDDLIDVFSKMQGIGKKSATRLAFDILSRNKSDIERLIFIINDTYNSIKPCTICHSLTDNDICEICDSYNRDKSIICVVENYKDVLAFEKAGTYNGIYHVLGGKIDPLNGITPDELNISTLIKRVDNDDISEIIIAINSDLEGETTVMYLNDIFKNRDIIISRIASGIPIGTNIEYIDSLTLNLSLEGRKKISQKEENNG